MYKTCCKAVLLVVLLLSFAGFSQERKSFLFNIKQQAVSQSITEFALQSDLNIAFLARLTNNIKSNALVGEYQLQQGLNILLENTSLRATISNNRLIKIERIILKKRKLMVPVKHAAKAQAQSKPKIIVEKVAPPTIERIEVVGKLISPYNLGTTVSSTKTQRDFLQTPQIVNALPESLIIDSGARNYADAVQLASSATYLERNAGVADELRLRGFSYPALKINGISSHAYVAPVDIAFLDAIEVAKGPNSVLYGRMEPGGIVNMMLKTANGNTDKVVAKIGNDEFKRMELDYAWTMANNIDTRLVGYYQQEGHKKSLNLNDAQGVMLALEKQFDNGGVLSVNMRRESQDVLQQFGSPIEGFDNQVEFFRNEQGGIDVVTSRQEDLRAGLNVDRDGVNISLTDWSIGNWSADFHFQYDQSSSVSQLSYPIIEAFIIDVNGEEFSQDDLTEAVLEDEEIAALLQQGLSGISINEDDLFFERAQFQHNTKALSAEFVIHRTDKFASLDIEQLYGGNLNRAKPESLIWQTHDTKGNFIPVEQSEVLFNPEATGSNVTDFNVGAFGQWVVNWQQLTSFIGTRIDYVDFNAKLPSTEVNSSYYQSSFRLGASYALSDDSSVFFNISESFTPQIGVNEVDSTPDYLDYPEPLYFIHFPEPAIAKQVEFGVKKTWFDHRLQLGCAFFEIDKKNIASVILRQKNRGTECDLVGSFGQGWHLTFAASILDAKIIAATDDDVLNRQPRMTPEKYLRLWLTRELLLFERWSTRISAGFTYVGERYIDSTNETYLPDYQVLDFSASIDLNPHFGFALSVKNLLDEEYIAGAFNAVPLWANQGASRALEASISYRF